MSKLPEPLSATNKASFAFTTIKDRLPVTITKTIDFIHRFRNDLLKRYNHDADDDIKFSIERLSQLRYELQTDKPFRQIEDNGPDAQLWNLHLEQLKSLIGEENCTWFKGPWLFSECYMYRRIREIMLLCKTDMKNYDPFEQCKIEASEQSRETISSLIRNLCPLNYEEEKQNSDLAKKRFHTILHALLWSNKNDLSLSSGDDMSSKVKNLIELLESFEDCILSDHSIELWNYVNDELISKKNNSKNEIRVDIVLDNCGIELASDLILCDFMLRNNFVDKIYLHAKAYYWFISDVTKFDFDFLMRQFQGDNSLLVFKFQERIQNYLSSGKLIFKDDNLFWNLGYSLTDLQQIEPNLFNDLKQNSSLVILKGDLNYRKLLGDLNWPFETPLSDAVRQFKPSSLCAIRTLKSDLIANLITDFNENKRYEMALQKFSNGNKWMLTGDYGLIQFLKI